jgi:hypothetical protein
MGMNESKRIDLREIAGLPSFDHLPDPQYLPIPFL